MIQKINRLKNTQGFTLVEMIVTLAIFSIVMVVAGNYLFFGNRMYATSEVKSMEKSIGDNMYRYMQDRLTYATKIELNNTIGNKVDNQAKYDNVFVIKDNHLFFSDNKIENVYDIYGSSYYNNYKVGYEATALSSKEDSKDDRLKLKVKVMNMDDTIAYETESIIECINLVNQKKSIEVKAIYPDKFSSVNPIISYGTVAEDNRIALPTELYDQMSTVSQQLLKSKKDKNSPLPEGWIEYCKIKFPEEFDENKPETWEKVARGQVVRLCSNDGIRDFIQWYYYDGQWPILPPFSEEVLEKNPELKKFVNGLVYKDRIYYQAYVCFSVGSNYGDDSVYVYVNTDGGAVKGWNTRLVYNRDQGEWYVGDSIGFANAPWDSEVAKKKWENESKEIKEKFPTINEGVWNKINEKVNGGKWFRVEE